MKMVHILYSGLGGHGAVLFTLLEQKFLEATEHHVIFIGIELPRDEYIARCEALNIHWVYVPRTPTESYVGFVISLHKKILLIDPDFVFSHGLAATPSLLLLRLLSNKKRFIVVRETQAHHLKTVRDWFYLIIANATFDRIVCLTKEAQIGAKEKLLFLHRGRKSVVVGNGLDTDYFCRDASSLSSHVIKIGMQSRLQANKDHRTLINAFNILCSTHTNLNFSLHIAGDGVTLSSLRELAASLGLADKVVFHGMLQQDALKVFLNDLNIYVHCTHGETMSTAIMQALSMSLPVIASDVWGVSNMIKNGNGLLYQPGDADDLASKLTQLIQNAKFAKTLGVNARKDAVSNYNNTILVEKYNNIFSSQALIDGSSIEQHEVLIAKNE